MRGIASSNVSSQPTGLPAFHAFGWIQRGPDRKVAIADLHQDCENFDDIAGGIVTIDGVRYICFAIHAFDLLPPYRSRARSDRVLGALEQLRPIVLHVVDRPCRTDAPAACPWPASLSPQPYAPSYLALLATILSAPSDNGR
jgi:hypothetical protein